MSAMSAMSAIPFWLNKEHILTTQLRHAFPSVRLSRRRLVTSAVPAAALATVAPPLLTRTLAAAQTPVATTAGFDAFTAELSAMIEEWMATLDVPGVAVGVIDGDQQFTAGFGVTNVNHPLAVDANTLFQMGSVGKTYTATAIMRLVEDGLIDLDAPVRTYLPEFQVAEEEVAAAVTVRQLLNHSAGWFGDVFTDTGTGDDALARYVELLAEAPQISPLGEHFSYNNASFVIAGRLIEEVTGQTYLAALTGLVLEPLGLTRTFLYPEQIMTQAFTAGHTGTEGGFAGDLIVAEPWFVPRALTPAGGHITSLNDLLRFARFHLGDGANADGEVVLQSESMAAFRTPTNHAGPLGDVIIDGIAAAWMIRDIDGALVQQHGGSTNGQEALLVLVPDQQFALALLTNATAGVALNAVISGWVLDRYLGLAAPELTPIDTAGLDLSQYAGTYGYSDAETGMGQDLIIEAVDGALTGYAEIPGMPRVATDGPLVFVGEDLVQFPIFGLPLLAEFVRDERGEVAWLQFSGRLQPKETE